MFEKKVQRKIFATKRDEVAGGWRKLFSEKLHNLYFPLSIFRMVKARWMRWTGHIARMDEEWNASRILVG
jgi:hypothetical protein